MVRNICIFEDSKAGQLSPLSLTRPAYDLRCGLSTLRDKILRLFPLSSVHLHCRAYLGELASEQNPGIAVNSLPEDACLFLNGRVLFDADLITQIDTSQECIYCHNNHIVAAFLRGEHIAAIARQEDALKFEFDLPMVALDARIISYPWDLVHHNAKEIERDFQALVKVGEQNGSIHGRATILAADNVYIGAESKIQPGVVIDAEDGPVYIGRNATVMPNAVITGPAFVGDGSIIKVGARIYEGTSIGEICKVGGEVEESIIHSFSNKQHDGFLGHAYLGQWVNIGADTNNSDLKNNYGSVKVTINGQEVDSGSQFVGLFVGDHTKTGINTMFNTGTVVGTMCSVFGGSFPPAAVPSFSWGGGDQLVIYDLEKAIDTARRVMKRRNVEMSQAYERLFRDLFARTKAERGAPVG